MNKRIRAAMFAAAATIIATTAGIVPTMTMAQTNSPVYGSQLMTQQERIEHRERMLNAKSKTEREQVRAEHHAKMQVRAKERGVTLPAQPPAQGMRKGMGTGPRKGMGKGAGSGRNRK